MLDEFNALNLWDFWIASYRTSEAGNDVLEIHAGTDFPTRCATLRFLNTEYISCPTLFHHARIRPATAGEAKAIQNIVELEHTLYAIDVEIGDNLGERTYFVAAQSVQLAVS